MKIFKSHIIKLSLLASFFAISSSSCNDENKIATALKGMWSIDTIYYQGADIRYCLDINVISFDKEDCRLPLVLNGRCPEITQADEKTADWEILKTDSVPILLTINTKNKVFSGSHKVTFKKDTINHLLKMQIESDGLLVICRKGLFSYESNTGLIDDLIRLSH